MKRLTIFLMGFVLASCSDHYIGPGIHGQVGVAVAPVSIYGNNTAKAGPTTAVSGGPNILGISSPTGDAVVARLANGLEGNAPSTQGNFNKAYGNMKTNLPKVTNVNLVAGYDQIELLAYAACSDLTTGGTPLMQSVYGIQPKATILENQAALIAAGFRILDQHSGSLASQGPASAQITTVLATLVQTEAATGSNTSTMAFMAVCIAASVAGSTLLGI